jgi:uncharacterized membrane protein (UPF0127 family)
MPRWVVVRNRSRGDALVVRARWCDSFACRLRGLAFRRSLPEGEGLVLVESRASRSNAAIHMGFVFFPLGIAWIDAAGCVVACRLALPWRLYVPATPAQYTLEGCPSMLGAVAVGDRLEFVDEAVG